MGGSTSDVHYIPDKEINYPKGWPMDVQYTNVCIGKNYSSVPLKDNEHKIQIREIEEFEDDSEDPNYGVFAFEKIDKGETICEYTGIFCTVNEKNKNSRYLLKSHDPQLYIDAESCGNSSRFINDYHNINSEANVTFGRLNDDITYQYKETTFTSRIIVKANRDIPPGEQLLVSYGVGYCKKWGII